METNNDEIQLVTVAVVDQPHKAEMIRCLLANDDIEVFIQDEIVGGFYPFAVGGIKIQVADYNKDKAESILNESDNTL